MPRALPLKPSQERRPNSDLAIGPARRGIPPEPRSCSTETRLAEQKWNWDIWRADAHFNNLVQLTDTPGDNSFGGWSPDGTTIVFSTKGNGHGEVWLMNRDGTNKRPLLTDAGSQSAEGWLPDGRILIADNTTDSPAWYLLKPDGSGIVSLPQLHGIDGPVDFSAADTPR
jgi:dipeptidyl aminopeptidase/acylaminoacyl peptidase